jgi:hypothetical protein
MLFSSHIKQGNRFMNSKQINFFVVPEDLPSIYAFFYKNKIKYVNKVVDDIDHLALNDFPLKLDRLFDQIYITSDDFKSNLNFVYDEKQEKYLIDSYKSYVLEFDPGGFYPASSRVLHRGRLYCSTSYFVSNGEAVNKSDQFKSWVDRVFRVFKNEFLVQFDNSKIVRISQKALHWMEENHGQVDIPFLKITI